MTEPGRIRIGTAGWSYPHWVGPFYPEGLDGSGFLPHYAARFETAEINNTFYRLPSPETLAHWVAQTPPGFLFACKASRYITHMKKLKDPETSTARFFAAVRCLGERCGPVLFQLPPDWHCNVDRLRSFLSGLPGGFRYAFEFRDPSWLTQPVYEVLRAANAALVIYDLEGETSPLQVTGDFVYVRLHGPAQQAYRGCYDDDALAAWASRLAAWREAGRDVFCYFDNDEASHAPRDAARLKARIGASEGTRTRSDRK
jgi:uncharacterized protein YecE (DUF72 family)